MKTPLLTIFFASIVLPSICQSTKGSISFSPVVKYDRYKEFFGWETAAGGKRFVKSSGISYGFNLNYTLPLRRNYALFAGIGYYKYAFSKMSVSGKWGNSNARLINFPSSLLILFYADRYWYNTAALNLGFEKAFTLQNGYSINAGLSTHHYFTFSQRYHLTHNPGGSEYQKKRHTGYFGFSAGVQAALLKQIGRIQVGPTVVLPLVDVWRKDDSFPNETNNSYRHKWLGGVGGGITVRYQLK